MIKINTTTNVSANIYVGEQKIKRMSLMQTHL